jgi:hypothetical protein
MPETVGQLLRIDLSSGNSKVEPLNQSKVQKFIGESRSFRKREQIDFREWDAHRDWSSFYQQIHDRR